MHTTTSLKRKVEVYFAYIDELEGLCDAKGLRFETVDRVLYVFDRKNQWQSVERKNTSCESRKAAPPC